MHCQRDQGYYLEGNTMMIDKYKWEIGVILLVFILLASMSA